MKNVIMILILFSAFTLNSSAQGNCNPATCKPCPPGCCIVNCSAAKGSAAQVSTNATQVDQLDSFMLGTPSCNLTKKEMKSCVATCKANAGAAASVSASNASPTCQPTAGCKSHQQTAQVPPTVYKASLQSKS